MDNPTAPQIEKPTRVGIVVAKMADVNSEILKFLILRMNMLQDAFEFEFLPNHAFKHQFLDLLNNCHEIIDVDTLSALSKDYYSKYQRYLDQEAVGYEVLEAPPKSIVILSRATLSDNFYLSHFNHIVVIALGRWKDIMAPPSIYDFMLTLTLNAALKFKYPPENFAMHLGTKGCLCDFDPLLIDVRYKVLNAFICNHCREIFIKSGYPHLADELLNVINNNWLGSPDQPNSPANIVKKLGANLYISGKLHPSIWERFTEVIQEEGIKQIITIIGAVTIAGLLLWLGLK